MKFTIPFIDKTLYVGNKEVAAAKERLLYGFWQNMQGSLAGNGSRIDFHTLYKLYNNVVDIKQSIKKIQNATSKEGFYFVDKNDPEKEGNPAQVAVANEVLDNNSMPFHAWKNIWVRDRHVAGNFYLHIEKSKRNDPIRVNVVDPRTMSVVADKHGTVLKYVQSLMGHEALQFDPDEIIHSAMDQSTKNPLLGTSPIEAIALEGQTEIESQKSNFAFYENHAVPSHLLIVDGELSKEQHIELKKQIDNKFKGTNNRFKSGIIPFIKDIKTITPSQKDMQYLETRWFTTKKIVVAFGVDSFILGYTEKVQRGNASVIYKGFYENTVRPQEVEFEEMINRQLLPRLGLDKIEIRIKKSNYDDLAQVAEITRLDVLSGIMTINEARKRRGLAPSDNELADEILFQGMLLDDLGEELTDLKKDVQAKMVKQNDKLYNLLSDEL